MRARAAGEKSQYEWFKQQKKDQGELLKFIVICSIVRWLMARVWSPNRVVQVRALARVTVLCSWARHSTVTVPLSTQVYGYRRITLRWTGVQSGGLGGGGGGGVEILLAASCYRLDYQPLFGEWARAPPRKDSSRRGTKTGLRRAAEIESIHATETGISVTKYGY